MRRIIGSVYHRMHRVLDMLCLSFTRDQMPAYGFHVQTQWRLVHDHQIILASRDMYIPYSGIIDDDWDYSPQGRPDEESSIFDVKCKEIHRLMKGSTVTNCTVSEFGDLRISFSNNVLFELFIPTSSKEEEWRMVDLLRNEHVVFYDI